MPSAISEGMKRLTNSLGGVLAAAVLVTFLPVAYAAGPVPKTVDLTQQFVAAGIHNVDGLRALEVGGIVILRGETYDAANAEAAGNEAQTLGYTRVANLIRVIDPPDDERITRTAERQLATRALDGCKFHLDSEHGVLTVSGTVRYELQKDVALSILRDIDGVRELRASFDQ